MAVIVNRMWSREQFQRGKFARIVFQVSGVEKAQAADVIPGFTINTPYDGDSTLLAKQPSVTGGYNVFEVTFDFERPNGEKHEDETQPLRQPPRILWQPGNATEQVDFDAEGNPLVNSASDPIDPPVQREVPTLFLIVRRWEERFRLRLSVQYQGAENSDQVNVFGDGSADPGQMRLMHYKTVQEYTPGTTPVECEYMFELRADGFDHRILDQGFNSFYSNNGDTGHGKIWTGGGSPVATAARLDGTGKPMNSTYTTEGRTPSPNNKLSTAFTVDKNSFATFLKYKRCEPLPFSALGLFT